MIKLFYSLLILTALGTWACQKKTTAMQQPAQINPLLCDVQTGVCELPDTAHAGNITTPFIPIKPVKIIYFTDPICSSCWGIEPQLRKLKLEYGDYVDVEYHMGGLLPDWSYNSGGISKPTDVAPHWDEVSHHYDMPIDGDLWLEDPLPSSYPPSIAFKAAQIQDAQKALLFLRRIREMVFLEKKNITRWEHLSAAAKTVGLNADLLKTDMEGQAKTDFNNDLALSRQMGVRGFPTLFFQNGQQETARVYGFRPYEQFEQALLQLHPKAAKKPVNTSWDALFGHYNTLTTREFMTLSGLSKADAERLLLSLVQQRQLTQQIIKNGILWQKV